jgi:hypothetical protein
MDKLAVGGVLSAGLLGLLLELPGKVLALISTMLLKPSPSESKGSMVAKLWLLFLNAAP